MTEGIRQQIEQKAADAKRLEQIQENGRSLIQAVNENTRAVRENGFSRIR